MGPRLPAWFRLALSRIDAKLRLQFMPPRTEESDGVNGMQYPQGVWVICKRMAGSGWLFKRWTWSLCDRLGRYLEPGQDTINLLQLAYDLHRRGEGDALEREFDSAVEATKREQSRSGRARLLELVEHLCRKHDFTRSNQVSMPM